MFLREALSNCGMLGYNVVKSANRPQMSIRKPCDQRQDSQVDFIMSFLTLLYETAHDKRELSEGNTNLIYPRQAIRMTASPSAESG
ncbi:unnamed protein product [Leuciscus chuanchicus]